MKKHTREITEDDLHAYVDHQLPEDKQLAVKRLMHENPEVAMKVRKWQQQNKSLQALFPHESFTEVPERLHPTKIKNRPRGFRITPFALVASFVLMISSGFMGWFLNEHYQLGQQDSRQFVNSSISAYQVYTVDTRHPVEIGADQTEHMLAWLSKRLKHLISLPRLQTHGFELLGGRLLSMQKGSPAAQFMYENKKGERITYLVSKNTCYRNTNFNFKSTDDINTFYWMDSGVAYSVSGEVSRSNLLAISKDINQQVIQKTKNHIASL